MTLNKYKIDVNVVEKSTENEDNEEESSVEKSEENEK